MLLSRFLQELLNSARYVWPRSKAAAAGERAFGLRLTTLGLNPRGPFRRWFEKHPLPLSSSPVRPALCRDAL
jgi:hypothetical protein